MDLSSLRYSKTHEWAVAAGDVVTVGITKFAVDQLTDVTHLELPKPGRAVKAGVPFGEIESVKAVSDLYSPVDGEVVEANDKLLANPATITDDSYDNGWLVKIKLAGGASLDHLMDHAAYEKQVAESH